jgi:uncharacterized protein
VLYAIGIVAVGLGVGTFGGMFGLGGGIIMVPILLYVYRRDIHHATAISLAVIGPMAFCGTIGNAIAGKIVWPAFLGISAGAVVGATIGATLSKRVPKATLRRITGFSVLLIGISMVVIKAPATVESLVVVDTSPGAIAAMLVSGLGVGIFSGMLGLGGGVILNPLMLFGFGYTAQQTVATSLAIIVPTSLSGAVRQYFNGHLDVRMFALMAVGACAGSIVGVELKNHIGNDELKTLLGLAVSFVALTIILRRGAGERPKAPAVEPAALEPAALEPESAVAAEA